MPGRVGFALGLVNATKYILCFVKELQKPLSAYLCAYAVFSIQ